MLNGKHILIVDDEPDLREMLRHELENLGGRVSLSQNSRDAKKLLTQIKPVELILSDIRMPPQSGVELIKELKEKNAVHPPFIFFTSHTDISLDEAYHLGADAIFHKPFNLRELTDAIVHLFAPKGERLRSQDNLLTKLPVLDIEFPSFSEMRRKQQLSIGRGGMFLASPMTLPTGAKRFRFRIALGDESIPWIEGIGILRWERKDGYGIEFESLSDLSRSNLEQMPAFTSGIPFIPKN